MSKKTKIESTNYLFLHRRLMEKAFYKRDSEKVHLWIHMLMKAAWSEREEMLGGKIITCKPGQFTTGRKQLASETGINESKIERILNYFEKIEQQIEQRKTNTNRLITVLNWHEYQIAEQQNRQQSNNDRTTTEQQPNTLKEIKNIRSKEKSEIEDITPQTNQFILIQTSEIENYLKSQDAWMEQTVCMRHHITENQAAELIHEFVETLKDRAVEHKKPSDAKQHFINWLKKQIENGKSKADRSDNSKQARDQYFIDKVERVISEASRVS